MSPAEVQQEVQNVLSPEDVPKRYREAIIHYSKVSITFSCTISYGYIVVGQLKMIIYFILVRKLNIEENVVGPFVNVIIHDTVTKVGFAEIQFNEIERVFRLRFFFNLSFIPVAELFS
jgi:Na+/glutamate symporter